MLKQNISLQNALIRMTCGFTLLSISTAKLSKDPCDMLWMSGAMCAALKISSGALRFCPITCMIKHDNCDMKVEHKHHSHHMPGVN